MFKKEGIVNEIFKEALNDFAMRKVRTTLPELEFRVNFEQTPDKPDVQLTISYSLPGRLPKNKLKPGKTVVILSPLDSFISAENERTKFAIRPAPTPSSLEKNFSC